MIRWFPLHHHYFFLEKLARQYIASLAYLVTHRGGLCICVYGDKINSYSDNYRDLNCPSL